MQRPPQPPTRARAPRRLSPWLVGLMLGLATYGVGATAWAECGDGVVDGVEECDDGNLVDGDGCTDACLVEQGHIRQCSWGSDGDVVINDPDTIVNTYLPAGGDEVQVSAGDRTIPVGEARGAGAPIQFGDRLLIIQM